MTKHVLIYMIFTTGRVMGIVLYSIFKNLFKYHNNFIFTSFHIFSNLKISEIYRMGPLYIHTSVVKLISFDLTVIYVRLSRVVVTMRK